jgi:hypothetical protein
MEAGLLPFVTTARTTFSTSSWRKDDIQHIQLEEKVVQISSRTRWRNDRSNVR